MALAQKWGCCLDPDPRERFRHSPAPLNLHPDGWFPLQVLYPREQYVQPFAPAFHLSPASPAPLPARGQIRVPAGKLFPVIHLYPLQSLPVLERLHPYPAHPEFSCLSEPGSFHISALLPLLPRSLPVLSGSEASVHLCIRFWLRMFSHGLPALWPDVPLLLPSFPV